MSALATPTRSRVSTRSAWKHEPLSVAHFVEWAAELELDNGESWVVEDYFAAFAEDYFAGVPECWLIVPEGNAKTTSLAGLAVYLLEFRLRAAIPWAASSREQAEIGYRQAEGFILSSPRLRSFMKCQEGYRRIKNMESPGRIQVFAADDNHADGIIPTDAFLDELHRHKNMRLYRTWRGKLLKRDARIATISTAGEPGSEFEETREQIRQMTPVVEMGPGFVLCRSDRIALHEWAVDEGGDVEDMDVVKAANPFSGITVEMLREKRESPTMTLAHWSRFTCNLPTRSDESAITEQEWFAAVSEVGIPEGQPVWAGLDLGWKYDTTALVPLWIRDDEFRLFGEATILEPPANGVQLDAHLVEQAILGLHARNPIHTVVMDMTNGNQLSQWIQETIGAEVVDRTQSIPLSVLDYQRFMEALREGWLKHSGDPGLTRHALNAVARVLPQGDVKFERPKESRTVNNELRRRRVIDALVAASMVHTTASAEAVPAGSWRPM